MSGQSAQKTAPADQKVTPMMAQYIEIKTANPDSLLFYRMGDFYELFAEDAVEVSKAIGLTLTERSAGLPMAGVPHHSSETYIKKMLDAGFRVAIADQIQDPKEAKGVVDRAVTRVLTPGTLVDETLRRRMDPLALEVTHGDGRSVLGELPDGRQAEAARTPGHDGSLAGEVGADHSGSST